MLRSAPVATFAEVVRVILMVERVSLIVNTPPPATTVDGDAVEWSVARTSKLPAATVVVPPAQASVCPPTLASELITVTAERPAESPWITGAASEVASALTTTSLPSAVSAPPST